VCHRQWEGKEFECGTVKSKARRTVRRAEAAVVNRRDGSACNLFPISNRARKKDFGGLEFERNYFFDKTQY
jgi:hypothetical protein